MAISKQQSMRPAEIELIDATNQHAQSIETLDKSLTALQQVRDSVSLDLTTMLTFNSGFSLLDGSAYRKNGVIYFDIGINCTTAQEAGVTFRPFTINSGYRPKIGGFGGDTNVYSKFVPDGTVNIYPINSGIYYWIAGSYLVE